MDWISVKDRLPEVHKTYLVYVPETQQFFIGYYTDIKGFNTGFGAVEKEDISHWMPLPSPPKD